MKKWTRSTWLKFISASLIFAGCFFMLGFFKRYHLPRIKNWLLIEIEQQSNEHLPLRLWPQSVSLSLFPIGIQIHDIKILPKPPLTQWMAPAHLDELDVNLSLFALFKGQIRLSKLALKRPHLVIVSKNQLKNNFSKKINFSLKDIYRLPVDLVSVDELELFLRLEGQKTDVHLEDASIQIENRFESLLVDIDFPQMAVKEIGERKALNFTFESRFLLDDDELQLSLLKLHRDRTYLLATGQINGSLMQLKPKESNINLRSQIHIGEVSHLIRTFFKDLKIPEMSGIVQIQAHTEYALNRPFRADFKLGSENLLIQDYNIGNLKTQGQITNEKVKLDQLLLNNSAGVIKLSQVETELTPTVKFNTQVDIKQLDLHQLLRNIKLGEVPVYLQAKGQFPCHGEIWPDLKILCKPKVETEKLKVETSKEKKIRIIEVAHAHAQGEVEINKQEVKYHADLLVGNNSKGRSQGVISYQKGFKIQYEAFELNFKNITTLGELNFEGNVQLKGTTEGNSKTAVFQMQTSAQNLWLENFGLGDLSSEVRYKEGILTIRQIQGRYGNSRYNGNLSIHFPRNEIFVIGRLPYAELEDLHSLLSRRLKLPTEITGTGSADFKLNGPIKLNALSYQLRSSFFRGVVAGETFDELFVNVTSNNGLLTTDRVQISKASSQATMSGRLNPEGKVDAVIIGRNLRLEQSEIITKLGLDISGQTDMTMSFKGPVTSPDVELHGRLSKVVIGDRPADDSNFRLRFGMDRIEGKGQFFGSVVQTDFIMPLSDTAPFRLHVFTKDWDFTHLFSIFSNSAKKRDFETALTTQVDLKSEKGGFWKSTGLISLNEIKIRRGPLNISLTQPALLKFESGIIQSEHLQFTGDNNFLKINVDNSSFEQLNASINAKLDMSFLTLLTPFLAEMRGRLSTTLNLKGSVLDPRLSGSAFVENAFIKLNEFPHPFENIRADLLFNQKNIQINALRANLGGGEVTAGGYIRLQDLHTIPIDINGQFKDVSLNFPDGVKSKGSGTVFLKGFRFPYTLGVHHQLHSGEVTKEFTEAPSSTNHIKPSHFLPKFVQAESFQPITLDLDIKIPTPIMVKNSMVESPVKGQLKIMGLPDQPRLTGVLNPQAGGHIYFRDTKFDILSSFIEYQDNPPDNPKIYLSAQARVEENTTDEDNKEQKNEYDIKLLVQGRAQSPSLTLSSQPPLSEQEIVSLLALGITNTKLQEKTSSGQLLDTGTTQLGKVILQNTLNKELKKSPVALQLSSETSENVSIPKITLNYQWNPKWVSSASRTVEDYPKNNVKLEYKVNKNFSIVGSLETQEKQLDTTKDTSSSTNKLGLDLEFKKHFK